MLDKATSGDESNKSHAVYVKRAKWFVGLLVLFLLGAAHSFSSVISVRSGVGDALITVMTFILPNVLLFLALGITRRYLLKVVITLAAVPLLLFSAVIGWGAIFYLLLTATDGPAPGSQEHIQTVKLERSQVTTYRENGGIFDSSESSDFVVIQERALAPGVFLVRQVSAVSSSVEVRLLRLDHETVRITSSQHKGTAPDENTVRIRPWVYW